MLAEERKRQLEDAFFLSDSEPENMNEEEMLYWNELTQKWNQTLLSIHEKIICADQKHLEQPIE